MTLSPRARALCARATCTSCSMHRYTRIARRSQATRDGIVGAPCRPRRRADPDANGQTRGS
eukprot:13441074-Alexandrium_andersonii.AAC.1